MIQRARSASVAVAGREIARIGQGLLVLLAVAEGDRPADVSRMAKKITELRIFADTSGRMNLALGEVGGELLVVSQFTLLADCRKGRRPSFAGAASPAEGRRLYEEFLREIARISAAPVRCGEFGAEMLVALENDGPVTLVLDTLA